MFEIVIYEDEDGYSEIQEWISDLNARAMKDKSARIQLEKLKYVIDRVEVDGTRAGDKFVKPIRDGIYELRPGNNRVMFFGWNGNHFVLLSQFSKEGQKTPVREIEKAQRLMKDWINRHGR